MKFFPLILLSLCLFSVAVVVDGVPMCSGQVEASTATSVSSWHEPSELARLICGKIPDASYDRRIRAVATLGKSISSDDFSALQTFLKKRTSDDSVTPMQLNAIKNDVAAKLLACEHLPDGFSRQFLAMVSNPDVGLVWQNYTIQFLDSLWIRETDPVVKQEIVTVLVGATQDERLTLSGTALLTLQRLEALGTRVSDSQNTAGGRRRASPSPQAGFSVPRNGQDVRVPVTPNIGALAMSVLDNRKIPWQDKITALHIAADAGQPRALATARMWGANTALPVMLRMASFSVIGKMGSEKDKPLLEKYARSGEFRLRSAARAALTCIIHRGRVGFHKVLGVGTLVNSLDASQGATRNCPMRSHLKPLRNPFPSPMNNAG